MKATRSPSVFLAILLPLLFASSLPATENAPEGWTTHAPREEIKPRFEFDVKGGPDGSGALVVQADAFDGQAGWWEKTFPVEGGKWYGFSAARKTTDVASPRRSVVARVIWQDEKGRKVTSDDPGVNVPKPGEPVQAELNIRPTKPPMPAGGLK